MHTVLVIWGAKEMKFEVPGEKSLHQEIQNLGTELPFGCLAGSCGACRIEILEGIENLTSPSVIEKNTATHLAETMKLDPDKVRLACRAKANGPVRIRVI